MKNKLDRVIETFRKKIQEETGPTMSVGTGEKSLGYNIDTDTPPVRKRKRRHIFGGKGSRRLWLNQLGISTNGRRN